MIYKQQQLIQLLISILLKYLLFSILFCITSCNESIQWLQKWQEKQIKKRYGTIRSKGKIEEWEKEIIKYENVISEKINAGIKLGKIYRKIGLVFADREMFEKCEENLLKAVSFGQTNENVFFSLGLCQGNLAQRHNWERRKTEKAIQTFLKVLNLNKNFNKAKYQLSLLYFYGLANLNSYRLQKDITQLKINQIRKKAILLMEKYQKKEPEDTKSYFALAGFYKIIGLKKNSIYQMQRIINILKRLYPNSYEKSKIYKSAKTALRQLQRGK